MTRKFAAILTLLVLMLHALPAQVDRTKMPGPGPAPAVAFPSYNVATLANGIRVIVVTNNEVPTVDIRLLIDRKPILEGEYAGYVDLAGELLRSGTTTRTKDQLDEAIDRIGASINSSGTSVNASGLTRYADELMGLMADVVLHPTFPKDELDKLVTQTVSGLKARKTEPDQIVELVRQKLLYGEKHPYGEQENEETVGRVTREKCMEMYSTFFKSSAAIIAVVGDITTENALALVAKHFGAWEKGTIPAPVFDTPAPLGGTMVALVDRPGAPQSVIRVGQTVVLPRTSPDVMPVTVMNGVLGGSATARLFMNLREKHAYTYGVYSGMGPDELIGAFTVRGSVKSAVTDSALMEIMSEIKRLRDDYVSDKELQLTKNNVSGAFVRSLENAGTIASYAIDMERYKLPPNYYKEYLKNIDAVTAPEVQRVAKQYLTPEKLLVAVVGPAKDVRAKLSVFGPVTLYDEEGIAVPDKPAAIPSIKADEILAKFIENTGGKAKWAAVKDRTTEYTGKVQTFEMKVKSVLKAPNKLYQEMAIPGMFKQEMGFDGAKAWSVSPQGSVDITGDALEMIRQQATMNFYGEYRKLGFAAAVTGTKAIKGKDCYEVSFTKPKTGTLRHYFTPDEFLKVREVKVVTTPQGDIDQTTEYSDYKAFKGYRVPTKVGQSAMGQALDLTLDKFEVNAGVKDALFKKPVKK